MSVLRHVQWSFLAVLVLCGVVALSSCSKKDVKEDEMIITPGPDTGEVAPEQAPVEAGSPPAADTGAPIAEDLQIVYFDFDSYRITSTGATALKFNADWLQKNPSATVQIEGHCDERGTIEYNLALGERRANAARDYLLRLGVDRSRVSVISYGEERPADPGHNEDAWAQNRRAAFVMLSR